MRPALYLIPVNISDAPLADVLPAKVISTATAMKHLIVENVRTARRFLKKCSRDVDIDSISFCELNGHTDPRVVSSYLDPLRRGEPVGLMSEAGCPAVADPGCDVVAIAQREGLPVVPLAGPSSILLSLMASGFNGQGFAFNGYLPIEESARVKRIRELEGLALRQGQTQIFIETPYRNNRLADLLAKTLKPGTLLCIACGITDLEKEDIRTLPAARWQKETYDYSKTPAIFLIGANA